MMIIAAANSTLLTNSSIPFPKALMPFDPDSSYDPSINGNNIEMTVKAIDVRDAPAQLNTIILISVCALVVCLLFLTVTLWRRKLRYTGLNIGQRRQFIPVFNWRLSASTMSLIGQNISGDNLEPEFVNRPDIVNRDLEQRLLSDDDDMVFRPTTTNYPHGQVPDADGRFRLEFCQGRV